MADATPLSFDDIIQADRKKRKNEALAAEIFGKGRRNSAPSSIIGARKAGPASLSLASRMGISKPSQRASSFATKPKPNVNDSWVHDLHQADSLTTSTTPRAISRGRPLHIGRGAASFLRSQGRQNGLTVRETASQQNGSAELRIRGVAAPTGPVRVIGENFARNTSAEDIEKVMRPYCRNGLEVTKISETLDGVTAEILFEDGRGAQNVIEKFNDIIADGRKLKIYVSKSQNTATQSAIATSLPKGVPSGPRNHDRDQVNESSMQSLALTDEKRRQAKAEVDYQDGSYGFESKSRNTAREDRSRRLYSDEIFRGRRGSARQR